MPQARAKGRCVDVTGRGRHGNPPSEALTGPGAGAGDEYKKAITTYNQVQQDWVEEMTNASNVRVGRGILPRRAAHRGPRRPAARRRTLSRRSASASTLSSGKSNCTPP